MDHRAMSRWCHWFLWAPAILILFAAPTWATEKDEAIDAALRRAVTWVETVRLDPFEGPILSFRLFTVEVEIWHRLTALETDPERRESLAREVRARLQLLLDRERFERRFLQPEASDAFTEAVILGVRCASHGLDPEPIRSVLQSQNERLVAEIEKAPPSLQLLYAVYLDDLGIDLGLSSSRIRMDGMLSRRPREVDLTMADLYYLTHEIYALTDYALRPLQELSEEEESWLARVLPFFTLFYCSMDRIDLAAELVTCLQAAGLNTTFASQEGIRWILENQNRDGSFGHPDPESLQRPIGPADFLHPTMNAITALALERASGEGGAGGAEPSARRSLRTKEPGPESTR